MAAGKPLAKYKRTVFTSHGLGDLGTISEAMALPAGIKPGPIRLLEGLQGAGGGFGRAHIESYDSRMLQLRNIGFSTAVSYVFHVVSAFDILGVEPDGRIVVVRQQHSLWHHVICQWDAELEIWSVTTAIPKNNIRKLRPVWRKS